MSEQSESVFTGEWVFEAADPEVGFFSDYIFHDCVGNTEGDPAEQESNLSRRLVTRLSAHGAEEQVVAEAITFTCPVCKATTAVIEHWPIWMFEEGE